MDPHCGNGIRTTGWFEPAGGPAFEAGKIVLVKMSRGNEQSGGRADVNASELACAAAGRARMTMSVPGGKSSKSGRMMARSFRLTACRITALPTALDTTKPQRGLGVSTSRENNT